MNLAQLLAKIDAWPHLGWHAEPTPVDALDGLAAALGLQYLGVKRDDLGTALYGGSKTRKLDFLAAAEPWASAPQWTTVGAIGSGHLVACTAAARALKKRIAIELFWEPLSLGVVENLAATASHADVLHAHRNRATLALTAAPVLIGKQFRGGAVIPPGGTTPVAMLGLVRAGVELAAQIEAQELPAPERIYVALGSGGTAAGLALGLGLAGVATTIHAVCTVEPLLATRRRLAGLIAATRRLLAHDWPEIERIQAVPLVIDTSQVGRGYGHATDASVAARDYLIINGIAGEDVYTGKAFAALLADARTTHGPRNWLFWNTVRRDELPAPDPQWRDRMPGWLRQRLHGAELDLLDPQRLARRRLLQGAGLAAGALLVGVRTMQGDSPVELDDWHGRALSRQQAATLMAAAEALMPDNTREVQWLQIAVAVDRYVAGLPAALQRDVGLMLTAVEHGQPGWRRFSQLDPPDRLQRLQRLRDLGGPGGDIWTGMRDLVVLGWYQNPLAWQALGYPGPMVPDGPRPRSPQYDRLVAPDGVLPFDARDLT